MKVIVSKVGNVDGRAWAVVTPVVAEGASPQVIATTRKVDGSFATLNVGLSDAVALSLRPAHQGEDGKDYGDSYTLYV